jgi:hypothetical protein
MGIRFLQYRVKEYKLSDQNHSAVDFYTIDYQAHERLLLFRSLKAVKSLTVPNVAEDFESREIEPRDYIGRISCAIGILYLLVESLNQ